MLVPGVLFFNKTYGREGDKHLYKFKPDNKDIPTCYVPYKIKNVGFSKVFYDLYVLVEMSQNFETSQLKQTIGSTNELESYYKYQMYCHNLILPQMKCLTEKTIIQNAFKSLLENPSWVDRTDHKVFSIDGENTTDYDDAFSIQYPIISVYISDVYHILDVLNFWHIFTGHVSNIYMPNERTMLLCKEIVELCSLKANKESLALTMDFNVETSEYNFFVSKIKPYKNFIYDELDLINDENYKQIHSYICSVCRWSCEQHTKQQSEKVVEYLMRLMCFKAGSILNKHNTGIFRTINEPMEDILPSNKYICFVQIEQIEQDPYAHITSPMRRLVDILNSIALLAIVHPSTTQPTLNNKAVNSNATEFYRDWESKLDYVNDMSRSVRRVQNESMLLNLYEEIKNDEHEGKVLSSETYEVEGIYYHTVFLKSIHLIARFQSSELIEGVRIFKVYKFDKESKFRKKIRLGLV
jgi:exoribonuclease R